MTIFWPFFSKKRRTKNSIKSRILSPAEKAFSDFDFGATLQTVTVFFCIFGHFLAFFGQNPDFCQKWPKIGVFWGCTPLTTPDSTPKTGANAVWRPAQKIANFGDPGQNRIFGPGRGFPEFFVVSSWDQKNRLENRLKTDKNAYERQKSSFFHLTGNVKIGVFCTPSLAVIGYFSPYPRRIAGLT